MSSPLLFVAISLLAHANEPLAVTPADVIAGYRQNSLLFRTIDVDWFVVQDFADNWIENAKRKGLEQEKLPRKITYHQQYLSDYRSYQVRFGKEDVEFPREELSVSTLPNAFRDIEVISYFNKITRAWNGPGPRDMFAGLVTPSPSDAGNVFFPPFGVRDPNWTGHRLFIDEYFDGKEAEYVIRREEVVDGRTVYVMDRVREDPTKGRFLSPDAIKKYGDDVRMFNITRAYIDPSRGYIPVRMEWGGRFEYQGKPLNKQSGMGKPTQVLEVSRIEPTPGAGFYPWAGRVEYFNMDVSFDGPIPSIEKVIETGEVAELPTVLTQTQSWRVNKLRANAPIKEDVFALAFPNNTNYYDVRLQKGFITKEDQRLEAGAVVPAGWRPDLAPVAESRRWQDVQGWVLLLLNVAVILVLGTFWMRRHRRRSQHAGNAG